jgi:hypothetical protein
MIMVEWKIDDRQVAAFWYCSRGTSSVPSDAEVGRKKARPRPASACAP